MQLPSIFLAEAPLAAIKTGADLVIAVHLDDAALTAFSYTVGAAAGGFLAISASVWIFIFERRSQELEDALQVARFAGSALYDFLLAESNSDVNYLVGDREGYLALVHNVTLISRPQPDTVPSWLLWRQQTSTINNTSREQSKEIDLARSESLKGKQWTVVDESRSRFYTTFVDLMNDVDLAVQRLDYVAGITQAGRGQAQRTLLLSIALLASALGLGLLSSTSSSVGVGDTWNLLSAVALLVGLFMLLKAAMKTFKINSVTRQEWIENLYRAKAKELGEDPDGVRRRFHGARPADRQESTSKTDNLKRP